MKALVEAFAIYISSLTEGARIRYRYVWKEWCQFIGSEEASGATSWDGLRYLAHIRNLPGKRPQDPGTPTTAASGTVRVKILILHALYHFFTEHHLCAENPFTDAMRKKPLEDEIRKRQTVLITDDEVWQLMDANSPAQRAGLRNRAFLAVLLGAGLRISEAANLRIRDIRHDSGFLVLHLTRTKSRRPADQLMSPLFAPDVERYVRQRAREGAGPDDFLFVPYSRGDRPNGPRITSRRLYNLFLRIVSRAGLERPITPHSCRATAITKLLEAGVDVLTVQRFARHASPTMTARYDKRRDDLEHAAERLKFLRKRLIGKKKR